MKKKVLLGLLPALLALSACAGTSPKDIDEGIFEEDTQLHEEVFEDAKPIFEGKSIRNLTPVGTGDPIIGVQSKIFEEKVEEETVQYISVRFVAALSLPSDATEVRWTRTLYNDNGNYYSTKPQTTKLCDYKYQNIYDNGSSLNIKSFGNDYTHFVAYALRKIPLVEFGDYYINMSLSIDGVEYKKIVSTSINQDRQVSYNYNSTPITGYFMQGTLGGNTAAQYPCDNETQGEGNQASFTCTTESKLPLVANDSFVIFHSVYDADVTKTYFRIFGHSSLSNDDGSFCFTNDEGRMKVKEARDYTLYLSNGNQIYTAASGTLSHDLYVNNVSTEYTNEATGDDKVACKLNLNANDKVEFKILGSNLHFYHAEGAVDDGDHYTATVAGVYYFYVNNGNKAFTAAPVTYTATLAGIDTNLYALYVVGNFTYDDAGRNWVAVDKYRMTCNDGVWSGTFELPGDVTSGEYQFVLSEKVRPTKYYWYNGSNISVSESYLPQTKNAGTIQLKESPVAKTLVEYDITTLGLGLSSTEKVYVNSWKDGGPSHQEFAIDGKVRLISGYDGVQVLITSATNASAVVYPGNEGSNSRGLVGNSLSGTGTHIYYAKQNDGAYVGSLTGYTVDFQVTVNSLTGTTVYVYGDDVTDGQKVALTQSTEDTKIWYTTESVYAPAGMWVHFKFLQDEDWETYDGDGYHEINSNVTINCTYNTKHTNS